MDYQYFRLHTENRVGWNGAGPSQMHACTMGKYAPRWPWDTCSHFMTKMATDIYSVCGLSCLERNYLEILCPSSSNKEDNQDQHNYDCNQGAKDFNVSGYKHGAADEFLMLGVGLRNHTQCITNP